VKTSPGEPLGPVKHCAAPSFSEGITDAEQIMLRCALESWFQLLVDTLSYSVPKRRFASHDFPSEVRLNISRLLSRTLASVCVALVNI
jgi:hypothetical protein